MSNDHRPPEGRHDERAFVNSADSHVVEPLDLWQERLPARLRDRAPRRIEQDGRWVFLVEGMAPKKLGSPSDDESGDGDGAGHFRAGGFDPDLRVGDLDEDGVWGEVLYPTIALFGFLIPDPELRWACARAYNDWLAETFASASKRFAGAAMIPVHEVATAVDELERVDEAFEEHASWVKPKLAAKPSDYVRRQGHVTFGNDASGVHNRHFTGVEPLLWASDYPHPEGTWPHTRETIARIFADVAPSEQAAIVGGTAASLYGFER